MTNGMRPLTICAVRWNGNYLKQAGVTTISLSLGRLWSELGCEVLWIGPHPPEQYSAYFSCFEANPTSSSLSAKVMEVAREHPIDVLVTFEPFIEGPAAAATRLAVQAHHAHFGMHFAFDDASTSAEERTFRSADIVVYQCKWFLDNYIAPRFGADFAYRRPHLIVPFGVDTDVFVPPSSPVGQTVQPVITFAGRLNRENCSPPDYDKGAEYLLEALPVLLQRHPGLVCVIIGDGEQLPLLEDAARAQGIADQVQFVRELSDRRLLLRYLQASSVFVLPSVCDVFPVAIPEAMAVGLPVISTLVGGIPEGVDDRCGILVEPRRPDLLATAVDRLLTDDDLRQSMGQQARQKAVATFDWKIAAEKTLDAFKQLQERQPLQRSN